MSEGTEGGANETPAPATTSAPQASTGNQPAENSGTSQSAAGGPPSGTETSSSQSTGTSPPPATGNAAQTADASSPPPAQAAQSSPAQSAGSSPPPAGSNPGNGSAPAAQASPAPTTSATPPPTTAGSSPSTGGEGSIIVGDGGLLQPAVNLVNDAVSGTNGQLQQSGDTLGADGLVAEAIDVVESTGAGRVGAAQGPDGNSNLITDVLNAPEGILSGESDVVIENISNDLADVLAETFGLTDEVAFDGQDPLNVVPELIEDAGSGLQTLPILDVDGNGLADGTVGDLTQSSSGHLIDVDAGSTTGSGSTVNLLATPDSGSGSTANINVLDVGADGPGLLDLNLLSDGVPLVGGSGDGGLLGNVPGLDADGLLGNVLSQADGGGGELLGVIDIPSLGGVGSDGLVGGLLEAVAPAAGDGAAQLVALPQAGIVVEVVEEVTSLLDIGQTGQNGLLGLAA